LKKSRNSQSPDQKNRHRLKSPNGLKLPADQGNAVAQFDYGLFLYHSEGVSKDLKGTAHYFKLAADQ
jgi:TPR repeat protein